MGVYKLNCRNERTVIVIMWGKLDAKRLKKHVFCKETEFEKVWCVVVAHVYVAQH